MWGRRALFDWLRRPLDAVWRGWSKWSTALSRNHCQLLQGGRDSTASPATELPKAAALARTLANPSKPNSLSLERPVMDFLLFSLLHSPGCSIFTAHVGKKQHGNRVFKWETQGLRC